MVEKSNIPTKTAKVLTKTNRSRRLELMTCPKNNKNKSEKISTIKNPSVCYIISK